MRRLCLALIFLSLLLLTGALGLRMPQECVSNPDLYRPSDRMKCYYESALTAAYLCDPNPDRACSAALQLCEEIFTRFGSSGGGCNDQCKKAELLTNSCYLEVAKITHNNYSCDLITRRNDFITQLSGDAITRETCYDQANRLAELDPSRYYAGGRNNICSLVFILPLIAVGAIRFRRP